MFSIPPAFRGTGCCSSRWGENRRIFHSCLRSLRALGADGPQPGLGGEAVSLHLAPCLHWAPSLHWTPSLHWASSLHWAPELCFLCRPSCCVSPAPSVMLSLRLRRSRSPWAPSWLCLLPSTPLASCFAPSPSVFPPHPLGHCTAFSAFFASFPFMLSFLMLLFAFLSLSLILIHNILKERLITLA